MMEKITYRKTLDVHKNGIQFMLQGFETADKMSRVVEISLMASGDAIDFSSERLTALMYVTSPGAAEPSIYECRIVDSKIVYEVLPIATEGITELQIKLIETDGKGAKSVLATPRFAIEVGKSNAEDEEAEKKPEFTALEEATARAKLVYDERFVRMEFTEEGKFIAHYADGTTYENDVLAKIFTQAGTDIDLSKIIENGLANLTADEVAVALKEELDKEYKDFFAKAVYSADLMGNYPTARFVYWDEHTVATPLKALLTDKTKGFALVMGDGTTNHTAIAWTVGENPGTHFSRIIRDGVDSGWTDGKVDLTKEVKAILPIANGGTGADTAEGARSNLDVPTKEELEKVKTLHDWNIDRNIGKINYESLSVLTYDKMSEAVSFDIIMINSGKILLGFKECVWLKYSSSSASKASFVVKQNDETIYTNTRENFSDDHSKDVVIEVDVQRGDKITMSYSFDTNNNESGGGIEDINIFANIETAYTYRRLNNLVDEIMNNKE